MSLETLKINEARQIGSRASAPPEKDFFLRQSQHIAHTGSELKILLLQPCEHWNFRRMPPCSPWSAMCMAFHLNGFFWRWLLFTVSKSKNHFRWTQTILEGLCSITMLVQKQSQLTIVNKKVLRLILFSVSLWKMIKGLRMGYLDSVSYL